MYEYLKHIAQQKSTQWVKMGSKNKTYGTFTKDL